MNPVDCIDLIRYPINQPSPARTRILESTTQTIAEDGCAVLKGFIRAEAIAALVAECDRVAPFAHRNFGHTNVYFSKDQPDLPTDHPARQFYPRSNAFVPADNLKDDSGLRAIYEWEPFAPFIQEVLSEKLFYRYADPLADVVVNLAEAGGGFPWHFDTNNYTVTLALQNAQEGGVFEYSPHLRTSTDENYAGVSAVLNNDRRLIKSLNLEPGDLQIFKGRYALHRVTPLIGSRTRYVAIFSFADIPDMVGSPERTRQLYGRVLAVHLERAGRRNDQLKD